MAGRLYIGNISSRTERRDIEDEFGRFGRINNISVKEGFAFVVRITFSLACVLCLPAYVPPLGSRGGVKGLLVKRCCEA